jgi:hypothetical protein
MPEECPAMNGGGEGRFTRSGRRRTNVASKTASGKAAGKRK